MAHKDSSAAETPAAQPNTGRIEYAPDYKSEPRPLEHTHASHPFPHHRGLIHTDADDRPLPDQGLEADEVVLAVGDIVLDVNETPLPLPNPPRDWAALPVPLTDEQIRDAERTVRAFSRGNPKMVTYERRLRIVCDIALKLIEHNAAFDTIEPGPGVPPLEHEDGGRRGD